MILVVACLVTFGDVKLNWGTLSMSFMHQAKMISIKGDPSLYKSIVTL